MTMIYLEEIVLDNVQESVNEGGFLKVKASELNETYILVGLYGGRLRVDNVYPSSSIPGTMVVETEHGCLYLNSNEECVVFINK